jgi:hypothetical protein
MKARFLLILTICILFFLHGRSQRVIEFGIKPTEFVFNNFEVNAAIGNKKARYGIFLSYRPSTQHSGEVKSFGSGAAGGYGQAHFNKLYNSYTVGLYQKTYLNKALDFYVETDIFYRNWSFKKKPAKFDNVEGYRFDGMRTENIDVYGLKALLGHTFMLTRKENRIRWYLDLYGGLGLRRQDQTFETYDGYVNDIYYDYKKDIFHYTTPSVQGGVKLGLMIGR